MRLSEWLQVGVTTSLHLPVKTSDYRAIKVHLPPADLDLYRALLPAPLTMPDTPMLYIELSEVSPTWHEGILSIACRHRDAEGWHGLYWAIDSYYPCEFGRLVGYPKFMAERMALVQADQGWQGEVQHQGQQHLRVDYREDASASEAVAAAGIRSNAEERPWYLQVPPEKGPYINRMTYFEIASPTPDCTPGLAHVSFDGDPRFAGLFPPGGASGPAMLVEKLGGGFGMLRSLRMRAPKTS